ncbi:MAG: chemotaxis protein CheB [Phormidesmis sp.]
MSDSSPHSAQSSSDSAFPIVGIGASAGGIEAFSDLLRELPAETGMALVAVQHLGSNSPSMLSRILSRVTSIPVNEATDDLQVQPDHIYVIPPNMQMTITDDRLKLTPRSPEQRKFMSIDIFFESLAKSCGTRAMGIVLSGLDGDGAQGLKAIKQSGGITFAQTENTAQYSDMPNSAVETGFVDFILPPHEIASELVSIARHPYLRDPDQTATVDADSELNLSAVYALLRKSTGIDFGQYKRTTFERRLRRRMALYRLDSLEDYVERLQSHPAEMKALCRDVLITVTSFFRDPEAFAFIKKTIFPTLIEQKGLDSSIRVWVAGCSTGQECYSLAIALFEYLSARNLNLSIQIFGTDVSEEAIDTARHGTYSENQMSGVSAERRQRFFTRTEGRYQISKAVRELCVFARQNLGSDPPFSNIDLISCRNVMIYFTPALQQRVLSIFHYSLNANGFLWLGSSESVGESSELFTTVDKKHKLYSCNAVPNRLGFDFVTSDQSALYPPAARERVVSDNPAYPSVQRQADQIVLNRYAPVGIVVNEQLNILYFRGDTSPYLKPAPGEPSFSLLKMVQPSLLVDLRSAIDEAKAQLIAVRRERLLIENNSRYIHLEVTPIKNPLSRDRSYLILFEEGSLIATEADSSFDQAEPATRSPNITLFKRELAATRQELIDTQAYLQATIEEHDATSQQLTTASEEILSSNEELQSTNEELQTAKEEIQASNEELKTTNEELQSRNADARSINDDLLNLLNNVNIPIVMLSNDLRIRRFTPNAQQLFNLIPTDVGRPVSDIRIDLEIADLESIILEVIGSLDAQEREVKDSAGHWYRLRIRPYRTADNQIDGAVMALVDIDDIKRTQQQLERSRLYAESIVDTVREPLIVLTADFQVNTANRAFYETFQVSAAETEARSLFELSSGQWNIPVLRAALEQLLADNVPIQDVEIEHSFQQVGRKTILLNACEIEQSTEVRMILLSVADITKRKRAEQERMQLMQERAARVEAEAANQSKDEFLSVLSHELRTPLGAIVGWTDLLLKAEPDPVMLERALNSIQRSAQTQSRIIEDLLEVSRIIQGQMTLQQRSVNLTELVESVIESMQPDAEKAGIQLITTLAAAPGSYLFDPDRLRQVFGNALSNAIKFTDRDGQISVRLSYTERQAHLQVTDTGRGIDPEFLPYVFDRFRQASSSHSRQYGGLGLGLAIIKVFVEAHEGTVQVSSPGTGAGTTLTITLPLVESSRAEEQATLLAGDSLLSELNILVVEDDADSLEILTVTLQMQGAAVTMATSVAEAIEKLQEEDLPDLLISDISLPGKDGFELIAWLRSLPASSGGSLPAIALTGYATGAHTEHIVESGFQRHLIKPVSNPELIATVVNLVHRQRSEMSED